jgi:hypothetical protein
MKALEENRKACIKITKSCHFMFCQQHTIPPNQKLKSLMPENTVLSVPNEAKFRVMIDKDRYMDIMIVNGTGSCGFIPFFNSTFQKSVNHAPEKFPQKCSIALHKYENISDYAHNTAMLLSGTRYIILCENNADNRHRTVHEVRTQMGAVLIG